MQPYFSLRDELSTQNDVVFCETRCVIPITLRRAVLENPQLTSRTRRKFKKSSRARLLAQNERGYKRMYPEVRNMPYL